MTRLLPTALLLLVLAAPAWAAPRVGTTTEGVRLALEGRAVTLTAPRSGRLTVECGAGRRSVRAVRSARAGQRVTVTLPAPKGAPEWCAFTVRGPRGGDRARGAATLLPRVAPAPAPLVAGPGVLSFASTEPPGATFLLRGRRLTVRFERAFERSILLTLVCSGSRVDAGSGWVAQVAAGRGRRVVTADLQGGGSAPRLFCLVENGLLGGRDLFAADVPAS